MSGDGYTEKDLAMGNPLGSSETSIKAPTQSSAAQNTSVGSGSRPGNYKVDIASSAPKNARTLDRDPPAGWLGSGGEKPRG